MPDQRAAARGVPAGIAARLPALLLPLVSLAALVTTIVLEAGIPAHLPGDELVPDPGWSTALTGTLMGALSAVILVREPRQLFGWALAWFGLFWALDGVSESYVRLGLDSPEPMPGQTFAAWFLFRLTALLPLTVALILLLFPTGRFLPGAWGWVGQASLAVLLVTSLVFLVLPSEAFAQEGRLPAGVDLDPTTWWALEPVADLARPAGQLLSLVAFAGTTGTVVVRYRRSTGLERDRMRWLLWGATAIMLAVVAYALLDLSGHDALLFFVGINLPPLAMTIAIIDPHLVSIEDLLGRTLVYGTLAVVVVAADLAVLAALTAVIGDALEQREVVLVVLAVTVAAYGPLRSRLWAGVRRLMLGSRDHPYDVVAGLASTLETADEGPAQLAAVARAVADAFGIGFVRVEVDRGGGERLVATHGTPTDATRTLPITYRGTAVGRLVLPARGLRARLSRRDQELLGDLVRQAATAARTSRLAEELQASRERLVVAREEERRRIRRDLHDGLGPSLSGVVFQLESARLLVDSRPEQAKDQLVATSTLVQDVVADVRRLVHDLRPPALDDRGLVGALRQQAERASGAQGPTVRVLAGDLGDLPAAVEVAAYRIAGEALTNVLRHAAATSCTVRLEREPRRLLVEVADDGRGIPGDVQAGVGLVSLRERAAELGGAAEVSCPDAGGTVVRAWLPVRRTHDHDGDHDGDPDGDLEPDTRAETSDE